MLRKHSKRFFARLAGSSRHKVTEKEAMRRYNLYRL